MIICSCNIISEKQIEKAIVGLLDEQEWRLITPAQVYHTLEKYGKCCGCFPSVSKLIVRVTKEFHLKNSTPDCRLITLMNELKEKHVVCESARQNRRLLTNQIA